MKVNERGSDPFLKAAIDEIQPILRRYDVMATVVLVSPTHSEFLNHLDTSWSVMQFEKLPTGNYGLRFRSKKEDWPSKEKQDAATKASAHALTTFIEWSRITHQNFRSVVAQLGKQMKIAWETWES